MTLKDNINKINKINHILYISKQKSEGISIEEVERMFLESNDLEEINSTVEQAHGRVYVSWASVDMVDLDNEKVPIDQIINDQDTLFKRGAPISDMHTNAHVGRGLAYKVMQHPQSKTMGVLHLNMIFDDNELDDKVWTETVSGERKGSSVGGFNKEDKYEIDEKSGRMVRIKDQFRQYETANVFKPSCPLALNESVSLIAKSARQLQKPAALDRCVASLMADPDFKPQEGRTKEESAFAVCQDSIGKQDNTPQHDSQKSETVINKEIVKGSIDSNKNTEGELQMDEEIQKQFDTLTKSVGEMSAAIKGIVEKQEEDKEDKPMPQDEDKPDDADKSKKTDKADDDDEDKPKDDEKKVGKEDAASDIAGEKGKDTPEAPEPVQPSDQDVFKDKMDAMEKKFDSAVAKAVSKIEKSSTPRPSGRTNAEMEHVTKQQQMFDKSVDIATGKAKESFSSVHKMLRAHTEENNRAIIDALKV